MASLPVCARAVAPPNSADGPQSRYHWPADSGVAPGAGSRQASGVNQIILSTPDLPDDPANSVGLISTCDRRPSCLGEDSSPKSIDNRREHGLPLTLPASGGTHLVLANGPAKAMGFVRRALAFGTRQPTVCLPSSEARTSHRTLRGKTLPPFI